MKAWPVNFFIRILIANLLSLPFTRTRAVVLCFHDAMFLQLFAVFIAPVVV